MKKLTLVCAHKPSLDPRIDWVASLAQQEFETTVVGMVFEAGEKETRRFSYPVQLVEKTQQVALQYRLLRYLYLVVEFVKRVLLSPLALVHLFKNVLYLFTSGAVARQLGDRFNIPGWRTVPNDTRPATIAEARKNRPPPVDKKKAAPKRQKPCADAEGDPPPVSAQEPQKAGNPPKRRGVFDWARERYQKYAAFSWRKNHFKKVPICFLEALEKMDSPMDVIMCADLDALQVGIELKKKYKIPLLYDAHEFFAYIFPHSLKRQERYFLRKEKKLLQQVDYVFTVNPFLAQEMAQQCAKPGILSVPNCAPIEKEIPEYQDELPSLANGRVSFLFQGGFSEERGLEEVLEAWKQIDPEKAALFLRGPQNECRDALENEARRAGMLGKSVYILPSISEDELIAAAKNADVGLIPYKPITLNYKYCCPNKLSQYMQAGAAILASDTVYVGDRVRAYHCGALYDSSSTESIVKAIKQMIEAPDALAEMKKNGQEAARSEYNWDVQSRPMLEVFKALH